MPKYNDFELDVQIQKINELDLSIENSVAQTTSTRCPIGSSRPSKACITDEC